MEFRTENVDRKSFIAMVHHGAYDQIGSAWERVFEVAGPKGWATPETEMVAVYDDDPSEVPEDQLKSYACISRPASFDNEDGFESKDVGGGRYLVGTFVGAYAGLGKAWNETMAKAGEHEHRDGDHFEKHLVHDAENPERCVTEIYVPIVGA